jgi:hypothetical protein
LGWKPRRTGSLNRGPQQATHRRAAPPEAEAAGARSSHGSGEPLHQQCPHHHSRARADASQPWRGHGGGARDRCGGCERSRPTVSPRSRGPWGSGPGLCGSCGRWLREDLASGDRRSPERVWTLGSVTPRVLPLESLPAALTVKGAGGGETAGTDANVGVDIVRVVAVPEGGASVVRIVDPRAPAQQLGDPPSIAT